MFYGIGKIFFILGSIIILICLIFIVFEKICDIKRIPGDIIIKKNNFIFYFPITTCILLSLFLTLIFNFLRRR